MANCKDCIHTGACEDAYCSYAPDPCMAFSKGEYCSECQYREYSEVRDRIWCRKLGRYMKEDGFCSLGERKDNV